MSVYECGKRAQPSEFYGVDFVEELVEEKKQAGPSEYFFSGEPEAKIRKCMNDAVIQPPEDVGAPEDPTISGIFALIPQETLASIASIAKTHFQGNVAAAIESGHFAPQIGKDDLDRVRFSANLLGFNGNFDVHL